jgi:Pentapeptide repeats (8 copies)
MATPLSLGDGNVGGGNGDWTAVAPAGQLIGDANGTFPSESGESSVASAGGGSTFCQGYSIPSSDNNNNCYSLQMNTNLWTFQSTPFTGTATVAEFPQDWQQFVFVSDPACNTFLGCDPFGHPSEFLYIQYVLINQSSGATNGCNGVSGMDGISWNSGGSSQPGICYGASPDLSIPDAFATAPLSSLELNATATQGGQDTLQLCGTPSSGLGCSGVLSEPDDVLDLAANWNTAEFNVFGAGGGSEAVFNGGTSLTVAITLANQTGVPLSATCLNQSLTAETNSLALGPCLDGPSITFTESIFGFTVSASPSDLTVLAGQAATYSVVITLTAGTALPVNLSVVSPLPLGASASFSANPVTPTGSSTLTITTSATGGLGDYPLVIQGEFGSGPPSEDLIENATVNLHVYDFSVVISPPDQTVVRGATPAVYALTLVLVPGSTAVGLPAVQLTISPSPIDAVFVLSGLSATPTLVGCTISTLEDCLSITVSTSGPPSGSLGDFTFAVTGTDPTASGGARVGTANLHIFDFAVSLAPPSATLVQGGTASMTVLDLPLPGSTSTNLPDVSTSLAGLPSGVIEVGFPASLPIPGAQLFTLESYTAASYVSCPHVWATGGQNLKSADLKHCDLAGYNLHGDNLQHANLEFADLQGANLTGANLLDANLASANTAGASFRGANLMGADLSSAFPLGTFLLTTHGATDGALRTAFANLTVLGDQLSGDNFRGANLMGANLQGDVLQGANFQGANLREADLAGTTLTGLGPGPGQQTNFNGTNLLDATLAGAICGTPNYITAQGANTHGVVGVPSGCNPPLDPEPALPATGSPMWILFASPVNVAGLAIAMTGALVAILVVLRATRGRRPPAQGEPKWSDSGEQGASPASREGSPRGGPAVMAPEAGPSLVATKPNASNPETLPSIEQRLERSGFRI